MAIRCVICGKKQSGFIEDFPLSGEYEGLRICAKCQENKVILANTKSQEEKTSAVNYFTSFLNGSETQEVDEAIKQFISESEERLEIIRQEKEEKERLMAEETEAERALEELVRNFMLTTGASFEGYNIKKYVGIVSGQVVLGTGFLSEFTASFADFFGAESNKFAEKLENAKNAALRKLILKANDNGGNAVIGIEFDYITFTGNMIGVVANGTSVIVEKQS